MKSGGISFGWTKIEEIYVREDIRVENGKGRRTNIVKHDILIDKYTLMNIGYTKQHFSEKTSSEVLSYLSVMLKVKLDTNLTDVS